MINSLTIFTKAAQMLAEANTIQKAKELKSLALTAAEWARRKNMGEEAIQHCRSYALDAERKLGELLRETARANVARDTKQQAECPHVIPPPTLDALGVSPKESSRAQALAAFPQNLYEDVRNGDLSRTAARRLLRMETIQNGHVLPEGKYRVIYADPPWQYNDRATEGAIQAGGAAFHYPVMTIDDLCNLPIEDLAEDNAVLFLWVTSPLLAEVWPIIEAWGFEYKASFVWDKVMHNMGHYNSVRHELLLLCTRGSCLPDVPKLYDSVQSIERTTHSTKPEEFRAIIDTLYPHGKRLELFARQSVENWEGYGNQLGLSEIPAE